MTRDAEDAFVAASSLLVGSGLSTDALARVKAEFLRIADIASEIIAEPMPLHVEPLPSYRP